MALSPTNAIYKPCQTAKDVSALTIRPRTLCQHVHKPRVLVRSSPKPGDVIENPDSEFAQKKSVADRLRAAEKFMVVGSGNATCSNCRYEYSPEKGDPSFPVPRGVMWMDLPSDYICPTCGAPKDKFQSNMKVVAGFAENQKYGLGTNSMTGSQKSLLIYGALAVFFVLFIAGYGLE